MKIVKIFLIGFLLQVNNVVLAENLSLQQVLQRVINHYPSIKSAAIQVQRARQENIKVQSQLSWALNTNAAYARETSLFGTPSDRYSIAGSVNKNLGSGGALGLNASVAREDSEDSFGPTFPNPLTKTRIDINYRHRFEKGADNPLYQEGLVSAQAGETLAISEKLALYDNLAAQVIDLYVSAATTRARINSINKTIERGNRLKKYIDDEYRLGLSEEKDVLQVNARLSINAADKKSLQVIWQQQLISLNRLMGRKWSEELKPDTGAAPIVNMGFEKIYTQTQNHSPALKTIDARLELADSAIRSSRDLTKDELDLVVFLGNEVNQGDRLLDDLDESTLVGGISLEYNRGLDKSGLNAALRQAHYDRGIALQDKKQLLEDLQYDIASLLAEIESSEQALAAFSASVKAEKKKLDEAIIRYKDGRIETDRIIEFESQLAVAELSYDLQAIELSRRYYLLNLLRGATWENMYFPDFNFSEYEDNHQQSSRQQESTQ